MAKPEKGRSLYTRVGTESTFCGCLELRFYKSDTPRRTLQGAPPARRPEEEGQEGCHRDPCGGVYICT